MTKRGSIGVHHTGTAEAEWDGPANEARLRTDGNEGYYKAAYAWQDPDGDPETKAAYKFIHHAVGEDGTVGNASTVACTTGIAVLNGGRGGSSIPSADRQGVYNHLAAHLKDADIEPPDLRGTAPPERERRTYPIRELRVVGEDGSRRIEGYAAVFDVLSVPLWGFRERIRPGAFARTIREADVRALWNHDSNFVLGRTKSGTLDLAEDDIGLRIAIRPPETQWARDLMVTIERGDVDQMSFGFVVAGESWHTEGNETIREVEDVDLFDVSPVTFPAYPQTTVQVRELLGADLYSFTHALERLEQRTADDGDLELLQGFLERVQPYFPDGAAASDPPADTGQDEDDKRAAAHARRELDYLKLPRETRQHLEQEEIAHETEPA